MKVNDQNYPEVLTESEDRRFWDKVNKNGKVVDGKLGPCWEWTAYVNRMGYGTFNIRRRSALAHRLSYTLLKGKVDVDLKLDHLCKNHPCVNPNHLEPVTQRENTIRGDGFASQVKKTHCPFNHPLISPNLVIAKIKIGQRKCLACDRARSKYSFAKKIGKPLDESLLKQVADEYYNKILGEELEQ